LIGNVEQIIHWLFNQDKEKLFEIKEKKKNRTLTQNSYAWELLTQLANALKLSKEDLYLKMLEDYGQSSLISVKSDIVISGFVKYYKEVGRSKLNDTEFTHYRIYKGSSQFDTYEMGIFIDGIIHECESVGIPTLTKEQVNDLKVS
jgi:hypothetical protein